MLDNRLVAPYFPPCHYLAMMEKSFRDRILESLDQRSMSKAELSRKSGVPYHAIDKFLKREGASTSADNARAIANTLGIMVDDDRAYEELRELFFQLDEEQRKFLIASVRGLVG